MRWHAAANSGAPRRGVESIRQTKGEARGIAAPPPTEGCSIPWWIPLSILLVVLIVAAAVGLLIDSIL